MSSISPLPSRSINQRFDAGYDIFAAQGAQRVRRIQIKTHVHFNTANGREVIALAIKEQRVKQVRRCFNGGWLAWAHHTVDIHERGFAVHVLICRHRVAHVRANIDVVDVEHWDVSEACIHKLFQRAADDLAIFVAAQMSARHQPRHRSRQFLR